MSRLRTLATLVVALSTVLGAAAEAGPATASAAARRTAWSSVSEAMVVRDPAIDEDSGITRSTRARAAVFVHNDSGDGPRIFALGRHGRTRAVLTLRGAQARDWEDIASGPHHMLWVGDIGDNHLRRTTVQVIRVHEPKHLRTRSVASRTYQLRYPDGPHNAEGLMVDPATAQVYVVTKARLGAMIYRAPLPLQRGVVNTLQPLLAAPAVVTGADFSPDGSSYVLRTYTQAFLYGHLGGGAVPIVLPRQRQGESIGFDRAGTALLVGSEGVDQPIWRIDR